MFSKISAAAVSDVPLIFQKGSFMGLDMYAYSLGKDVGDQQTDIKVENREQIAYWRKFNHLHGLMEDLYFEKGGKSDVFNFVTVRLNNEDLDNLKTILRENRWEHRVAFLLVRTKYFLKIRRVGSVSTKIT